jgi:hypothetical protein
MIVGAGPNRETVFGICARDGCMPKTKPKPKLTDAERRKRFVEMAREVQASQPYWSGVAFRGFRPLLSSPPAISPRLSSSRTAAERLGIRA